MNRVVRGAVKYTSHVRANVRPRYVIAYGLARLVPVFAAGPLIARLYRWAGFDIGDGCSLMGPVRVLGGAGSPNSLTIGTKVYFANDVVLNVDGPIDIGDAVSVGPFVKIYTATHAVGPGSRRMLPTPMGRPVSIGRGTWVGAGVLILPGVSIGDGCVIGAGSVVMSDVPGHSYAEGNPAVVVRELPWQDR